MTAAAGTVLGIDPGRSKAGYALVRADGAVVDAGIEALEDLPARLEKLLADRAIAAIALGRGTNSRRVGTLLARLGVPIHWVDEFESSRAARKLYFAEHPPRGWRRLIPLGLQLPGRPVDDYAAIVIARRFLARGVATRPPR